MSEPLIINDNLKTGYDFLNSGVMIIDEHLGVRYINRWIRQLLLIDPDRISSFSDFYPPDQDCSKYIYLLKRTLQYEMSQYVSATLSNWIIPLHDDKTEDGLMRQRGVFMPGYARFSNEGMNDPVIIVTIEDVTNDWLKFNQLKDVLLESKVMARRLEKEKERAEAATIAKSQFLSNISHEIRTPMNGVVGMLDILLETALSSEQKDYALSAQKSADSLLGLFNDILDFSRGAAGDLEIEKSDFDLRISMEILIDTAGVRADEKGVAFSCLIENDVPARINGDSARIRQVINNLIENSLKFTETGSIDLKVSVKHSTNDYVILLFEVTDTGIGVPDSKKEVLFESFTQADLSTTREYGGAGLGLSICKQLTELMGGAIGVTTENETGSTFWFTARCDRSYVTQNGLDDECRAFKNKKILIIDSTINTYNIFTEYIKPWKCITSYAPTANAGLILLKNAVSENRPFDAVLMEVRQSAIGDVEIFRSEPDLVNIEIVLLIPVSNHETDNLMKETGLSRFITRPLKERQVRLCFSELLKKSGAPVSSDAKIDILLVDDNKMNQKVLTLMLEKMGYMVSVANNGLEAVDFYKQKKFDLVLMDQQMPVMGGLEAAAEIRKIEEELQTRTPVIALTANATEGVRDECLSAGMDDFVTKPLKKMKVIDLIEKYCFK